MTSPLHILVVEDDLQLLGYLCALLASWGYTCDPAKSAQEAMSSASRRCPDVVISDLVMPGMDGIDLLKALRAMKECPTCFVLITGNGTAAEAVRAVMEGANEVYVKPIKEPVLRKLLQKIEEEKRVKAASA